MTFIIDSNTYGRKEVIIDDEDWNKIKDYKWYVNAIKGKSKNSFYVKASDLKTKEKFKKRKTVILHRLIMDAPKDKVVDHINHNELDNRKVNLRICSKADNSRNRSKVKNSTSKYLGVNLGKGLKKYRVAIRKNYKPIHIGYFKNEIDAAKAYDEKAKELHGEYANLNFKEEIL